MLKKVKEIGKEKSKAEEEIRFLKDRLKVSCFSFTISLPIQRACITSHGLVLWYYRRMNR